MFAKAIKRIGSSFFPIFFQSRQGNRVSIGILGTGFFIDNKGLFVTANHVVANTPTGSKVLYLGNVPHKIVQPIELKEIYRDVSRDVYVGRLKENFFPGVRLAKRKPPIGTSICLCGYPLARLSLSPKKILI